MEKKNILFWFRTKPKLKVEPKNKKKIIKPKKKYNEFFDE